MRLSKEGSNMLPTEDPMPVEGALLRMERMPRNWTRSMAKACRVMDALLEADFQSMDLSHTDKAVMGVRELLLDGSVVNARADYVCRSDSSHSRMLRIVTPHATTSLILDMHQADFIQGWDIPRGSMGRHHAILVFRQFASLLRSLTARAGDIEKADENLLVRRAEGIGIAMGGQTEKWVTRLPWTLGDGLHGPSMTSNPAEPIPEAWAGDRVTMIRGKRGATGLYVHLSPYRRELQNPVSAIDAMRAIAALPPLALASAA